MIFLTQLISTNLGNLLRYLQATFFVSDKSIYIHLVYEAEYFKRAPGILLPCNFVQTKCRKQFRYIYFQSSVQTEFTF